MTGGFSSGQEKDRFRGIVNRKRINYSREEGMGIILRPVIRRNICGWFQPSSRTPKPEKYAHYHVHVHSAVCRRK
jgi:hypothetical protein